MPQDTFPERVEQAIERLYEDEALRSNLNDASAELLLAWAARAARSVAAKHAVESDEELPIRTLMAPIRRAIRDVNELTELRSHLSDDELRLRVAALLANFTGTPAPKGVPVNAPVMQGGLTDRDFVARLITLLEDASRPAPPSERPAPPPAPRPAASQTPRTTTPRASTGRTASRPSAAPRTKPRSTNIGAIIAGVLAVICIVGSVILALFQQPTTPEVTATPVTTGAYTVYFTDPQFPDNPTTRRPTLGAPLASLIASATQSVDMAIYQLDLPEVVDALLDAVERDVEVRVVTDIDILFDEGENAAFIELEDAGVTVVGGNSSAIMHDKFVVVDNQTVWTGSWNFTENDTYRYNNNAIRIESPDLARNYTATFEKMWENQEFGAQREPGGTRQRLSIGGVTVENYFSPEDGVEQRIVERINNAQETIDFMAFSFTSDPIGQAVMDASDAGVTVRGVFENTGSLTEFSEFTAMLDLGLPVYQDGNPYLMHHKVFIIDHRTVILGSYNFSQNAEDSNDENILIIDDPNLANQFLSEFQRVYAEAENAAD